MVHMLKTMVDPSLLHKPHPHRTLEVLRSLVVLDRGHRRLQPGDVGLERDRDPVSEAPLHPRVASRVPRWGGPPSSLGWECRVAEVEAADDLVDSMLRLAVVHICSGVWPPGKRGGDTDGAASFTQLYNVTGLTFTRAPRRSHAAFRDSSAPISEKSSLTHCSLNSVVYRDNFGMARTFQGPDAKGRTVHLPTGGRWDSPRTVMRIPRGWPWFSPRGWVVRWSVV